MKNKKSNISYKKGCSYIIEFSAHRLKLAKAFLGNRSSISYIDTYNNPSGSEEGFIRFLQHALKEKRLGRNNVILSLDRSLVTIRFIILPSVDEKEIESMAHWQAAKLLPYKIEQIIVSHRTLQVNEEGFSHVLLVIAPRLIVKKYIDICQSLKLQPESVTITSEGLLDWRLLQKNIGQNQEAIAIIDAEEGRLEVAVTHLNEFIFSRSINLLQITQEQTVNKVIEEITLSLDSYRKQSIYQPLTKIILVGDKKQIINLSDALRNKVDIIVEVFDHLENIKIPKRAMSTLGSSNISFASIVGLVLKMTKENKINLLPQEFKENRIYLEKKKEFVSTLFLLGLAGLIFFSIFGFDIYSKTKIIEALNSKLEKINPKATAVEEIKKRITIINEHLEQEGSCIDILRELHIITPQEVFLNTFIYEEERGVTIKGTAPSMSVVFSFVPILNKSDFFEDVGVRYATQRKMVGSELTDFEIICPLKKK